MPLPTLQVASVDAIDKKNIKTDTKTPQKAADVCVSLGSVSDHFVNNMLDMSFSIMADLHGETKQQLRFGRIWSSTYPVAWQYTTGGPAAATTLAPAPAFAGFAHGIQDQSAMRALAALAATIGTGPKEPFAEDARATINAMFTQRVEATRLLVRMAALWTAAATCEAGGDFLFCHSNADDTAPKHIAALGDYSMTLMAAHRQGAQPVFANVRGAAESQRYVRIARLLALNAPRLARASGTAAPSVAECWPPIPAALACYMSPSAALTPLAGVLSARDIAIFISHYARSLNLLPQLADWLQFACGFAYRPAGSEAFGTDKRCILQLPQSRLGPTVLLPIVQAVDTLDDEGICFGMDEPAPLLFTGAMRAATFLTAFNNVTMTALGDRVSRLRGPARQRALNHQQRLHARSTLGTASVCAALALASDCGWDGAFAASWLSIACSPTIALGTGFPVEAEECIPWLTALPSTAAVLGLLRPCHLLAPPSKKSYLRVGSMTGRLSESDAFYSLMAIGANPQLYHAVLDDDWPAAPTAYTVKTGYRSMPTDGQFLTHHLDNAEWVCLFRLTTHGDILRAMRAHETQGSWNWTYEWHVPYSYTAALATYIEHGSAPQPRLPDSSDLPPDVLTSVAHTLPPPPNIPPLRLSAAQLSGELSAEWATLVGAHEAIAKQAGRTIGVQRLRGLANTLGTALTTPSWDGVAGVVDPELHPALWSNLALIAQDTVAWTTTSLPLKDAALRVYELAMANYRTSAQPAPPPRIETQPAPHDSAASIASSLEYAVETAAVPDFPIAEPVIAPPASPTSPAPAGSPGSPVLTPIPQGPTSLPPTPPLPTASLPQPPAGLKISSTSFAATPTL
jgi:hypothetical protein